MCRETTGRAVWRSDDLTDGIGAMMQEEKVLAYRFKGVRYDCGSKLGYLQAMVAYGKKHPETGAAFAAYLKSLQI